MQTLTKFLKDLTAFLKRTAEVDSEKNPEATRNTTWLISTAHRCTRFKACALSLLSFNRAP